jgi:two-component system nitrogen regulation response regulator NtrX
MAINENTPSTKGRAAVSFPLAQRGLVRSPAMLEALNALKSATTSTAGVVLCGEPGTGGEIFARAIHLGSHRNGTHEVEELLAQSMRGQRSDAPFVVIDCAASPLLEQRLFGTAASVNGQTHAGVDCISGDSELRRAFGGTLVLSNLLELPGRLQARVARILRDGEACVHTNDGFDSVQPVRVRPIAMVVGTNVDEERVVPELRRYVFGLTITMPPLRERREDMPALIRYLLTDICTAAHMKTKRASKQATALLSALPWPGNLQQLEGLLRMLVMKVPGDLIRQADVLANVRLDGGPTTMMFAGTLKQARAKFEREYVASVLAQHKGRMSDAARTLGIQRTNLYRKVRQLSVDRRAGYERRNR